MTNVALPSGRIGKGVPLRTEWQGSTGRTGRTAGYWVMRSHRGSMAFYCSRIHFEGVVGLRDEGCGN
eukprot:562640-Hanusia_phi.AAC.1